MSATTLKRHFRDLKEGRPGHRFQDHYAHEKKARHGHSSVSRIVKLALGVALVAAGIVFCVIPGPGLPIIFIGGALLAAESKIAARFMDWLELRLRRAFNWGKGHWETFSPGVKIAVVTFAACAAAGAAYLLWQWMQRR